MCECTNVFICSTVAAVRGHSRTCCVVVVLYGLLREGSSPLSDAHTNQDDVDNARAFRVPFVGLVCNLCVVVWRRQCRQRAHTPGGSVVLAHVPGGAVVFGSRKIGAFCVPCVGGLRVVG